MRKLGELFPLFLFLLTLSVGAQVRADLCAKVGDIKALPVDWSVKGADATYDELVAAADSTVPCLIDNVTNRKRMPDPRCPHISEATTIGDVSYFILVDILKIGFTELLPADVRADYKTHGAYAYHDYIDRRGARKELQARLRKWYSEHKGKQS